MQIALQVHNMPYGIELIMVKGVEARIRANCCISYHSNPIAIGSNETLMQIHFKSFIHSNNNKSVLSVTCSILRSICYSLSSS